MMIAGFVNPDSGDIFIGERSIVSTPVHRQNIGIVFQHYSLFPHMTAAENVAFPLKMRKLSSEQIRNLVRRTLQLVELTEMGERYPRQLSGGQQQRVALARALVFDPPILLMDEPLGALDKKLRESMQLEIKRIQEQLQITTVYVTHDQGEALTMSDRIAVMNHIESRGSLRTDGTWWVERSRPTSTWGMSVTMKCGFPGTMCSSSGYPADRGWSPGTGGGKCRSAGSWKTRSGCREAIH